MSHPNRIVSPSTGLWQTSQTVIITGFVATPPHLPQRQESSNTMNIDTLLDVAAVAERLQIKPETVRYYHKRGTMPRADQYFGRSPAWKVSTIKEWESRRRPAPTQTPVPNAAEIV